MNFQLTEEHEMIRKMVRDFAENEVEPTAAERDEEDGLTGRFLTKWQNSALPAFRGRKNTAALAATM